MNSNSRTPAASENSSDPLGEFPVGTAEYFIYLLWQAARQRDLLVDNALKDVGLNLVQWRALAVVRRIENCTMSALSRYSGVERSTLTRAADQMVEMGLIERWVPDHDRRQVNMAMTGEGEATYARAVGVLKEPNARMLEEINPKSLREGTRVLQEVLRGLVDDDALAADLLTFGRPDGAPRP